MSDEWKAPVSQGADEGINGREEAKSWKLLEKTLLASVPEQRRARRWGIFFKLLTFAFLFVAVIVPMPDFEGGTSRRPSHTALTDVQGVTADKEAAMARY
ncbi:S49 family peptidase, partial [Pseudomonas syringae]